MASSPSPEADSERGLGFSLQLETWNYSLRRADDDHEPSDLSRRWRRGRHGSRRWAASERGLATESALSGPAHQDHRSELREIPREPRKGRANRHRDAVGRRPG